MNLKSYIFIFQRNTKVKFNGVDKKMVLVKEIQLPRELYDLANEEFDCKWTNQIVKIKRFKFGDSNEIARESTKIKTFQVGGEMKFNADIDPTEIQVLTLLKGIVAAPWQVGDKNAINELPPPVANWVLLEIETFNTVNFKKKEN